MERTRIFVTRKIPEAGLTRLQESFDVEVSPFDRNLTPAEIIEMAAGAQGMVSIATDTIDKELIDRLTDTKNNSKLCRRL